MHIYINIHILFNKQVKFTFAAGLNGLRRLHTLNLARNQLISTSGLGETPTIQQLDLSHNHLKEVLDINKLCLLQVLNLSANNLLEVGKKKNEKLNFYLFHTIHHLVTLHEDSLLLLCYLQMSLVKILIHMYFKIS
jgi:hypothetical protein